MRGKILVACIVVLLFALVFCGCLENDKKENTGNNQNNGETVYNGDVSVSTDKTTYISGELVNITVTFENKMDRSFPFGNYSFELNFINKSEYYSGKVYSKNEIPWNIVDSITVSAGETYTGNISWNTAGIEKGNYLIEFGAWETDMEHFWSMGVDTVMAEIAIT